MTSDRARSEPIRRGADLGATLTRGLLAGAAGVAAMTLAEKVEQRVTGRPNSFVPAHTLRRILGLPARPDRERIGLNWTMHWGQGIALGPLRMLMAERGMRGSVASFLFLNIRLINDQALENLTGAGAPPWTWPRDEQRIDLLHKAIYAFVAGYVADQLARSADRERRHGHADDGRTSTTDDGRGLLRNTRPRRPRSDGRLRRPPEPGQAASSAANRAFGVRVDVPGRSDRNSIPVLVIARDEQEAELVAAEAAGSNAQAEVFRELTAAEIREHRLDLNRRGSVTTLAVLNL